MNGKTRFKTKTNKQKNTQHGLHRFIILQKQNIFRKELLTRENVSRNRRKTKEYLRKLECARQNSKKREKKNSFKIHIEKESLKVFFVQKKKLNFSKSKNQKS